MSVSQPALTPSTVSRRRFLTVAGAGVTTSALLTMLDARQAPAQIKGTTLRILQWSHFIPAYDAWRSEEHTSELQPQSNLECRLLLEKKQAGDPHDKPKQTDDANHCQESDQHRAGQPPQDCQQCDRESATYINEHQQQSLTQGNEQ